MTAAASLLDLFEKLLPETPPGLSRSELYRRAGLNSPSHAGNALRCLVRERRAVSQLIAGPGHLNRRHYWKPRAVRDVTPKAKA